MLCWEPKISFAIFIKKNGRFSLRIVFSHVQFVHFVARKDNMRFSYFGQRRYDFKRIIIIDTINVYTFLQPQNHLKLNEKWTHGRNDKKNDSHTYWTLVCCIEAGQSWLPVPQLSESFWMYVWCSARCGLCAYFVC